MTSRYRLAGGVALAVLLASACGGTSTKTQVATTEPEIQLAMRRTSNPNPPTTSTTIPDAHTTVARASRSSYRATTTTAPHRAVQRPVVTTTMQPQVQAASVPDTTVRYSVVGGGHRGYATAKACTSMVENGGSYDRSSNPGHFGRYQFARETWVAYGGDPNTWGHASPQEQDAVFERAWNSPGGSGNWTPYNGC